LQAFLVRKSNLENKKPDNTLKLKKNRRYLNTGDNNHLKTARSSELEFYKVYHKIYQFQENKEMPLFENIEVAGSFFSKLTGLIFKKNLKRGSGFLIENCNTIHTLWMRFSIDVLYLDKDGSILHILHSVKPFRFTSSIKGAVKVLEIKSKAAAKLGLQAGDILRFK